MHALQAPSARPSSMIWAFNLFTLVAAVGSESDTPCNADDISCEAEAASGSMLMQMDRSHKKHQATHQFLRLVHRAAPNGFCNDHPCRALLEIPSGKAKTSQLQSAPQSKGMVGKTAVLTQAGYEKVAALKDDTEMTEFILRVIDKYDCKVTGEGGFSGIVPWFSGTTISQSLPQLEDTLLFAVLSSPSWLSYKNSDHITGDKADLGFLGYVQMAALKNDLEMKKFVRRVCTDMGVKVVDEGGFTGMVKFYSGSDNFQSYDKLRAELKSAANAPHSWADWVSTPSKAKASLAATTATTRSSQTGKGFSLLAVRGSQGFCKSHPCRLPGPGDLGLLQTSPKSADDQSSDKSSSKDKHGVGKSASLDSNGYKKVAELKDDTEMKEFILRMVDKYDCKVVEMGGMMGIVPWFSGSTTSQDIQKLEDTLLYAVLTRSKPWLSYKNSDHVTGETAKLGFVGYVQVAAMRNDTEMKKFVRRVCKEMGVKVVEEGGFEGMVKFYSGTDNFQSYERLQSEIKSAANAPHSWANWLKKPTK